MELKTTHFLILFLFEPRLYTLFFETIKAFAFRIDSRLNCFFFFLAVCCCVVLTTNRVRWSRKISSIFIFFHFRFGKKRLYGAVFNSRSQLHRVIVALYLPSFPLPFSFFFNSRIFYWASRPIDTTSSSLDFATRARFPWQWQSVDDRFERLCFFLSWEGTSTNLTK